MEKNEQPLDIEYEKENININYINSNNNKEQIYKLDFNFDILNEPMPDFTKKKKNEYKFLNKNNYTYKRNYNEINPNSYLYHGTAIQKIS